MQAGERTSNVARWFGHARRLLGQVSMLITIAGLVIVSSGCGGQQPPGDPGNKRLHELAADPVFAELPAGATLTKAIEQRPAQRRQATFDGGADEGPAVIVSFSSARPPAEVYGFYAHRAAAAGWQPHGTGFLGLTVNWQRSYSTEGPATLVLYAGPPLTAVPAPRTYQLAGNLPAKA